MSIELEAFERIKKHTLSYTGDVYKTLTDSREMQAEDLEIIESALKKQEQDEKEHKALDIIKEHKLLNYVLKNEKCANMYHLSEEEKESLKEVLL